jgi:parallel beta-helix repeat protein
MSSKRFVASFTVALVLALALALMPPARPVQADTYTVTNTNDSGVGSLRWAINQANANPGADTITFNIPGAGVHTIAPLTALPALTGGGTTIDGYSQPGAAPTNNETPATILIEIDGTNTTNQSGLYITSADNVVRGLAINRFDWDGIGIGLATGNVIAGNHLGTDPSGMIDRGNGHSGVYVGLGATNNTIGGDEPAERNVLSGNEWSGVEIHGSGTTSNTVSGNYIGTQATGMAALGNTLYGVRIYGGAQNNTIGGDTAGERNVISGNAVNGVHIAGEGTTGNVVSGNYIGTTVYGIAPVGNAENGVYITLGAQNNVIGGDVAGERNVISGNDINGVDISGSGTTGNTVSGNYIGTDAGGTADLGNSGSGVYIYNQAQNNTVGGDAAGERNVISGNEWAGVGIHGSNTMSNTVSGNYIGTDVNGTSDRGNGYDGVHISSGAQNNTVGGDTAGERNVISGNDERGVRIIGSGTTGNTVSGNYIGTDVNGTADLGNTWDGVYIVGAQNNTVGGDTAGERNIISGNNGSGVYIQNSGANTVSGNYIGTDVNGTVGLGNSGGGVYISSGAQNNTVGGDAAGERNVISGNDWDGVTICDSGTTGNTVSGNYIGTDVNGTADLGNTRDGVYIYSGAQNNTIGGDEASERNVISGNALDGIGLFTAGSNVISGNYIGTDASGSADLGNARSGVFLSWYSVNNTIGGATAGERNVISGNGGDGIWFNVLVSDTVVSGNYIGTDANGTADLGNDGNGVFIERSPNNLIGGDEASERNVISGSDMYGIHISGSDATGNTVSGNYIGTDASGTLDLSNGYSGVLISDGAQNNTIGGDTAGERNVISGNGLLGVHISGSGTTGNTVSGNYIGTDANSTTDLGNTWEGVAIWSGAQNNTVGGDTDGERNVISGNDMYGVTIIYSGTTGNTVSGNYIGTDANGTADLGNSGSGVYISSSAQNNTVGPGNVIAYNGDNGVEVYGSSTSGNIITQNSIFANGLMGIDLREGANGGIAAPVIVTTTVGSVHIVGTACADCTVEVFENSDTDGEGETYVGDITATTGGAFTVTVSYLTKPYLTATATDATDGTSEFSEVFMATVPVGRNVYLPIILKNH